MTTSVTSLAERVRDLLEDYDEAYTTLAAAISTTNATTCTLTQPNRVKEGSWLSIDFETLYVTSISSGPPYTATISRGKRGSTAATHLIGADVLVDPKYPSNRILTCLNIGLNKLMKIVKDDATLSVVESQYTYAKPSTVNTIYGIEIENSNETNEFFPVRGWDSLTGGYFRLIGDYPTGRNIRVIGRSYFSALNSTGNLDSDFPDTDANAINAIVYEAAGQLLLQRQGRIAGRDSFTGVADPFSQSQPDQSIRTGRQYLAEAEQFRRIAKSMCPILRAPVQPVAHPSRSFDIRQ